MSAAEGRTAAAAARVFDRLRSAEGEGVRHEAVRLPVCQHVLDGAYAAIAAEASPLPEIASAFAALEGGLVWSRRKGADPANEAFYEGHANAMLIGPGGIEQRNDVQVGATVMRPGVTYPDHNHPPEEVYLALTDGEWWNAEMPWTRPGPGGLIYNPPGILHSMRAGHTPFLALWFLPVD